MTIRPEEAHAPVRPEPLLAVRVCALGVDVGSTNTKVVLVGIRERSAAELARSAFATPDDPAALVAGIESGIREVLSSAPSAPVAVGIASMAETGVPLDRDGAPVGPLLRWNAAAAPSRPSAVVERLGADELFAATGVPPLRKTPLLLLELLRDTDPERWARLDRWAGAGDLATLALTNRLVTDHTLAGRTLAYRLPAAGDPLPSSFDAALLAEVGLRPDQLPAVAIPGAPAGTVIAEASVRTGLAAGTPVFVAGHDHAVGAWGADVRRPGERVDSLGTSEALLRVAGAPLDRAAAFAAGMSVTRTASGDRETLLSGSPAGGSLIAMLLRGDFSGGAALDPAELFRSAPTGPAPAVVLPYPLGRQSPAPDRDARLRFVDTDGADVDPRTLSRQALAAAVLAGLCLQLRWMNQEQDRITGTAPTGPLRLIGGAAAGNTAWATLKSEVLAEPLQLGTAAEPVAASAALLAAVRQGAADPAIALGHRAGPRGPLDPGRHAHALAAFVAAATTPRQLTNV